MSWETLKKRFKTKIILFIDAIEWFIENTYWFIQVLYVTLKNSKLQGVAVRTFVGSKQINIIDEWSLHVNY